MDIKVKSRFLLAFLISAGFMIFLLLRIEWRQFSSIASRLDVKYLIAACSVFMLGNLIRALRFYKLAHTKNKLTHWWNINAFYNFLTATLPGGTGEAATAYVLKRFAKLNMLDAVRILLISRVMDLLSLSAFFVISAILISSVTPYREASIWISGALFLISLLALLRSSERFFVKIIQKLPGQNNLKHKICEKLSELMKISEEQRRKNTFSMALFQSILMTFGGIVSVHLLLRSLGVAFTPIQSAYCYGIYMIFQVVPVQGIAGIGTQAAWWSLALHAAGYSASDAIALGMILHGTFYIFITIIGITAFFPWLIYYKCN